VTRWRSREPAAVRDAVVVLGVFLAVGLVCALAWWLLVDLPVYTSTGRGEGAMEQVELAKRFNADGWYAVLGAVGGFLAGLGLTWWRSRDYLRTVGLLLPGAGIGAATTALVGGLLGPDDPRVALATAARGEAVPVALQLSADVAYLVWPIAALAGALMVLWSSTGPARPDDVGDAGDVGDADTTGATDPTATVSTGRDAPDTVGR
jgi:hypothetical protein